MGDSTSSVARRRSPCRWLGRDEDGRPFCEHGAAHKQSGRWRCREVRRRYKQSAKGRETKRREQEKRVYIGGVRFTVGFTEQERKELLHGTTHRP